MFSSGIELSVQNLNLATPRGPLLGGVSLNFTFTSGYLNLLRGPNGIGKSTLVEILARHTAGVASGTISYSPRMSTRDIAYLPQFPKGVEDISIEGLIELSSRHAISGWRSALPDWVIRSSRSLGELSGGQRQLLLALAVLSQARPVFILDEPLAALDHDARGLVVRGIARLVDNRALVIVVSHNDSWAGNSTMPTAEHQIEQLIHQ